MRFVAVLIVVLCSAGLLLADKKPEPGLRSKHADVGHKSTRVGSAPAAPKNATANELSKIEHQRVAAQSQQAQHASAATMPKAQASNQGRTKPIKLDHSRSQSAGIHRPH
jgi:hypothetical protein